MAITRLGLSTEIEDHDVYRRTVARFRDAGIVLPTFAQLANPTTLPVALTGALERDVDPDAADPRNLFRVHWYNAADRRGRVAVPEHIVLPKSLTGVDAPIVVVLGRTFPMIRAHKVLAAYGCLAPRLVTGQFDPTRHRAVWPSTGNYCRGGVAISRIMGCRGVAVLPEGMSRERFEWLGRWVADPADIIRTPGSESNVKEIYDRCAELDEDPDNVIFNQFCEFGNHLIHRRCTGAALEHVLRELPAALSRPELRPRAYVSATGSAGTLAAGSHLKRVYTDADHDFAVVAVEAVECPTLLYNGFGEHNIQGIGDKHVPFIHDVHDTDYVVGVSERSTDALGLLFNQAAGREYLVTRRGVPEPLVATLDALGLSSIANVIAAIKLARHRGYGPDDAIVTVATDGAELYGSERETALARALPDGRAWDLVDAAAVCGEHLAGVATDHLLELTTTDRDRIFNLGYFTWVEQQGVSLEEFTARRDRGFWRSLGALVERWDARIEAFNAEVGRG